MSIQEAMQIVDASELFKQIPENLQLITDVTPLAAQSWYGFVSYPADIRAAAVEMLAARAARGEVPTVPPSDPGAVTPTRKKRAVYDGTCPGVEQIDQELERELLQVLPCLSAFKRHTKRRPELFRTYLVLARFGTLFTGGAPKVKGRKFKELLNNIWKLLKERAIADDELIYKQHGVKLRFDEQPDEADMRKANINFWHTEEAESFYLAPVPYLIARVDLLVDALLTIAPIRGRPAIMRFVKDHATPVRYNRLLRHVQDPAWTQPVLPLPANHVDRLAPPLEPGNTANLLPGDPRPEPPVQ